MIHFLHTYLEGTKVVGIEANGTRTTLESFCTVSQAEEFNSRANLHLSGRKYDEEVHNSINSEAQSRAEQNNPGPWEG